MTFLLRATGPALVSWPVLALVIVWSTVLSLLGSGSTASGSLVIRAAIACVAGAIACAWVLLAWWLLLRRIDGVGRVILAVIVVMLAGSVRGFVVQVGFVGMGFADGTVSGLVMRVVPSIFTISFAFLVGAAGVAAVLAYRRTAGLLLAEQRRLVALLDASALGIEERQSNALERVQQRLDAELRDLAMESGTSAVSALESLAGEVVRPLSHSLARELPQWDAQVPDTAPRVTWTDVWRDPLPSAAIRPIVLPALLLVIALPAALFVYEPRNGLLAVAAGTVALTASLTLGRIWLVRRPPRQAPLVWLAIVGILLGAAFLTSRAASIFDRNDASVGAIPSLTFFVVPVFGLIVATVSMMGARMNEITEELAGTTRQLAWNLARINTQQWEQSGRLSRALHGPVQTMLHARLLLLRRQLESGTAGSLSMVEVKRDLQEALTSSLSATDPPALAEVLTDVAATWQGLAQVAWQIAPDAQHRLAADPLCTRALADLATEAVSNSVRHGKAVHVDIRITDDADELVSLRVVDDGTVPATGIPGLGTVILTRCTYDWSLTREPTTLTARLPCAAASSSMSVAAVGSVQ